MLDDLAARYDPPRMMHQIGQQPVFVRGKLDRIAIDRHPARACIEVHWTAPKFARGMADGALQQRSQPCKDFLDMEGLGDIIVSPGVETLNLVAPPVAGSQNQHRHGAAGPAPFTEHGSTILFGQAQIQDNGIVRFGVAQKPSFFTIEGAADGIARLRKRGGYLAVEIHVILDDEQPHAWIPLCKTNVSRKNLPLEADERLEHHRFLLTKFQCSLFEPMNSP